MKQNGVTKMNFKNVKVLGLTSILSLVASCSNPSNFEAPTLHDDETSTSVFGGEKLTQATPEYIFALTGPTGIRCHGTRISDNYILTAAHCFTADYKATQWPLMRLDSNDKPIYYKNAIINVTVHPKYQEKADDIERALNQKKEAGVTGYAFEIVNNYDLALVKVRPEHLPSNKNNPVEFRSPVFDMISVARGMGIKTAFMYSKLNHRNLIKKERSSSNRLLELDIFKNVGNDIGSMWIHDSELKISICNGDSGSGVFIKDPHAPSVIYLIGTIDGGPTIGGKDGACTKFSSLANVTMAQEWISEVISR